MNFKYYFNGASTILGEFSFFPSVNESEKKLIKSWLSEKLFISQLNFKNLCQFLNSEKWVEEWDKALKGFKSDFNVVVNFSKISILDSKLEEKDFVFIKPNLEFSGGDEEELAKVETLVGKTLYSIVEPKDFREIKKKIEKIVSY